MSTASSIAQSLQPDLFTPCPADVTRLAYVHVNGQRRDSDAWYTPLAYIESARRVMGSIDLDPFSSAEANQRVRATAYLSRERSALIEAWRPHPDQYPTGMNVFMNPPFGENFTAVALGRLHAHFDAGDIQQAIVVVNNATETQYFQQALCVRHFRALCLTHHRIAFLSPDGKAVSNNTRGQALLYFATPQGQQDARFQAEFAQYGLVKEGAWGAPPLVPPLIL